MPLCRAVDLAEIRTRRKQELAKFKRSLNLLALPLDGQAAAAAVVDWQQWPQKEKLLELMAITQWPKLEKCLPSVGGKGRRRRRLPQIIAGQLWRREI